MAVRPRTLARASSRSLAAVPVGGDSIFEISGYGEPSASQNLLATIFLR